MFVLSKLAWLVLNPISLLAVVLVVALGLALFRRSRRLGFGLLVGAVLVLLVNGIVPTGSYLTRMLEDRFPAPAAMPARVDGIIVLSGFLQMADSLDRGQPQVNDHADRLVGFLALARRYPEARLVFTGGSASIRPGQPTEASIGRELLAGLGAPMERILFEDRARNTAENARFSLELAAPKAGETWLLVTSAFHMPRAVACFRAVGWDVVPYPVDYQTGGSGALDLMFDMLGGWSMLGLAVHEFIGILAYRALGYTDELWPAPAG
jgi:uncharacterized SAM-binding protein YcdF (DUF218 family)